MHVRYVDVIYETPQIIILQIGVAESDAVPVSWVAGRNVRIGLPGSANATEIRFDLDRGSPVAHWDQAVSSPIRFTVDVVMWRRPENDARVTIYDSDRR